MQMSSAAHNFRPPKRTSVGWLRDIRIAPKKCQAEYSGIGLDVGVAARVRPRAESSHLASRRMSRLHIVRRRFDLALAGHRRRLEVWCASGSAKTFTCQVVFGRTIRIVCPWFLSCHLLSLVSGLSIKSLGATRFPPDADARNPWVRSGAEAAEPSWRSGVGLAPMHLGDERENH